MSDFTPRGQQVLALARKEAERLNHDYVGTEKHVGPHPEAKMIGNIPYTPRVKKVLALAGKECAICQSNGNSSKRVWENRLIAKDSLT
jgi:ATP-dependent Clp protease ATP-binding subunit ClpC